ncbi:MAG: pyridoxal-phosphate dependent enzyme [Dehalococcoidia bacterium]|nr:pyridoxal-phosphate dependent enzyme [Dehalococcoidia bacterium]
MNSSPPATTAFPLFQRFPQLEAAVPRVPLSPGASPVAPLAALRRRLGGDEIWIKNDGLYGTLYGGNKPRKLEFLLADAQRRGARTVLTTGALGTNHGLATALYAPQFGLKAVLLLTYEQPSADVARQLCRLQRAGAVLHYTGSLPRTVLLAPYYILRYASRGPWRWPYILPPGGSTPLGALGYVNAALELAAQIDAGELPEPDTILAPLGSAGTAAGLLLGLRIAGLRSRLLPVAITRAPTAWAVAVARRANAAARLLTRRGARLDIEPFRGRDVQVSRDWLSPGFGRASFAGEEARVMLRECEGLELDSTYTAKTMAALIHLRRSGALPGRVLYWHTYNAIAPAPPEPAREDRERLPAEFQRFLQAL